MVEKEVCALKELQKIPSCLHGILLYKALAFTRGAPSELGEKETCQSPSVRLEQEPPPGANKPQAPIWST